MSAIWEHATKDRPCVICQKPDWCCFGDRAMKCMRIESAHPSNDGGWYHFYTEDNRALALPIVRRQERKPVGVTIDFAKMFRRWQNETTAQQFIGHSELLGINIDSLCCLGACYAREYRAWAWPMKNAQNVIVGARLRSVQGIKWAVTGSRQGVFIPSDRLLTSHKIAFVPEGPTDTAALLSIGLYAIGRPTALACHDVIKDALAALQIYSLVAVADNDDLKKKNLGSCEWRPGIEAAVKLRQAAGIRSCLYIPPSPHKDVRSLIKAEGHRAKAIIEADLRTKIWNKL